MADTPESPKASGDVLVQHPSFPDQVLIVPADKVDEHVEAGWLRVKRGDEEALRPNAVPAPTSHQLHFGTSLVP